MKKFIHEGHTIAYRDEGDGPVIVLVHGTPSSSAEFEEVIAVLRSRYRCIAIDHLGFGQSDKPESGDYRLQEHTERLRHLLNTLAIEAFHLVVHDFGGAIALPVAIERWDQVKSLTVMNSWAWPLQETEPALRKHRPIMTSSFMKFLYKYFNFSARILVKAGWGKHRPLTPDKHKRYRSAFASPSQRMGTVSFLMSLFDATDPAWQIHRELATKPPKPTLLLWGSADPMITEKTLEHWKEIIPKAKTVLLDNVGHFVADEAPEHVVQELEQHFRKAEVA